MRKVVKWTLRVLGGLVALVLLAGIATAIFLHTSYGREFVRAKAEAAIASAIPGSTIGAIDAGMFGGVTVRDLVIAGDDGKPVVRIGEIRADVSMSALVRKAVRVEHLTISGVEVAIGRKPARPAAEDPKPQTADKDSTAKPWSIELPDVVVSDAKVTDVAGVTIADAIEVDAAAALAGGNVVGDARVGLTWHGRRVVVRAGLRRDLDTIEVPLATVALDGGKDSLSLVAATYDGDALGGELIAHATRASIEQLAGVELADDVALAIDARSDGMIDVRAGTAGANVHARLAVDVYGRSARGTIYADVPDASAVMRGLPPAGGTIVASLVVDRQRVRGMVAANGERDGHRGTALFAVDATPAQAWLNAQATSDFASSRASVTANVMRKDGVISLVSSTISARTGAVDAGGARARASTAELEAKGQLWPKPELRVGGEVDASDVAFARYRAGAAHVRLYDLRSVPSSPTARAHVEVVSVTQGGAPLGSLALDVRGAMPPGGPIAIDVDSHRIATTKSGIWAGAGGHVVVDGNTITLRDFHTGNGSGRVDARGSFDRVTGDVSVHAGAKEFTLAMLGPPFAGTLGGTADIARVRGRWDGTVSFGGHGLVVAAERPPIDATGSLALHGRKLAVVATASSAPIGEIRATVDLDTPYDITDVAAWKRSERKAIRSLSLALGKLELSGFDGTLGGTLDGTAEITGDGASGGLHLRGLRTPAGAVDSDFTLGPDEHGHIVAAITAHLADLAAFTGEGEIALPTHPFDPDAWRALGRGVLAGGELHAKDVALDPRAFTHLGIDTPYRARADIDAELATGATRLTAKLALHDVHGGVLHKSLEATADATIDQDGARVTAGVRSGAMPLLALTASSPITIDTLSSPGIAYYALDGAVGLPVIAPTGAQPMTIAARNVVSLLGRDDVLAGTLGGTITIAGTLGTPTARAVVTAKDIAIRASVEGRPPAKLADLSIDARWGGSAGAVDVVAHEAPAGKLELHVRGSPRDLAALQSDFQAEKFDVAPLTAFAPGALGAARGLIEASLGLQGFDPDTGEIHGKLHVHDARVPLHALIGTLRNGDLDLTVENHAITGKVSGKLGTGEVKGTIGVKLSGSTPSKADADLQLSKISLIRAHRPIIDGHVVAHFTRGAQWLGDITIRGGHVLVPSTGGTKLLEATTPSDMVFTDAPPPKVTSILKRPPPSVAWLVLKVDVGPTELDVQDDQYQVAGRASGKLDVSIGDGIGAEGAIDAERGEIQLFGQRSQLDHGSVIFDGTLDPLLDIRVIRDLDSMIVTADVGGRASTPSLSFSTDTGSYSQGELMAFFVGGTPGGDRGEVGQAAVQAGAGIASQYLSKHINKQLLDRILPVKLDLEMRFQAATSTSSEATGFGRRINRDTYVEYRHHVEARPDENANEGVLEYRIRHTEWRLRGSIGDRNYDSGEVEHRWHW